VYRSRRPKRGDDFSIIIHALRTHIVKASAPAPAPAPAAPTPTPTACSTEWPRRALTASRRERPRRAGRTASVPYRKRSSSRCYRSSLPTRPCARPCSPVAGACSGSRCPTCASPNLTVGAARQVQQVRQPPAAPARLRPSWSLHEVDLCTSPSQNGPCSVDSNAFFLENIGSKESGTSKSGFGTLSCATFRCSASLLTPAGRLGAPDFHVLDDPAAPVRRVGRQCLGFLELSRVGGSGDEPMQKFSS
jgi:hypothetical protein